MSLLSVASLLVASHCANTQIKIKLKQDCRRVGRSMATFMRSVPTGAMAVDAWARHYPQTIILFDEVPGFEEFIHGDDRRQFTPR